MVDQPIPRRNFLRGAGAAGTAAAAALSGGMAGCAQGRAPQGRVAASEAEPLLTLDPSTAAFLSSRPRARIAGP